MAVHKMFRPLSGLIRITLETTGEQCVTYLAERIPVTSNCQTEGKLF